MKEADALVSPLPPRPRLAGPRPTRLTRRVLAGAALLGCGLWLAGCATPQPTHFHTLMAQSPAPRAANGSAPPSPGLAWELLPIGIPVQVDRPQMVVQLAGGSLAVVEQERWIAPLADELHAAVAEQLSRALGAPEPGGPTRSRWRVRIDVQRLDSAPGRWARLEAIWSVRSGEDAQRALHCQTSHEQPVAPGYSALAAGHREALVRLAEAIASNLRALAAGQLPACAQAGQ